MKFIKYALLTLFIAVVTDVAIVWAYASPTTYQLIPTLVGNNSQTTPWLTKTVDKKQRYKNTSSITVLNNPCPNCEIMTTLYLSNSVITKMGQTKSFNDISAFPNDYRITISRNDFTLLNTSHSGTWYINS